MKKNSRFLTGVATVSALLLLVAGSALAGETDGEDQGDTIVNVGYDSANHVLVFNATEFDSTYDCSLNGMLSSTYGLAEDGSVNVDGLESDEGPVEFPNNEDVGEDHETADAPALFDGPDGPCGLIATVVSGPNGQINHGQFMKSMKAMLDDLNIKKRGCINRILAQSDLGKGDQQVRTSDVDADFEVAESGEVEVMSHIATCDKKKDKPDKAKPDKAKPDKAKPDKDRGKSADAPGRNK